MNITKTALIEQGWEVINEFEDFISYHKTVLFNGREFHLTIRELSNTIGRDFFVHVDNCDFDTVGSMDVATFEQINKFLELLSE